MAPADGSSPPRAASAPEDTPSAEQPIDADSPTLGVLRLRYIRRVIAHMKNNKTRAAQMLGIDRRTLNRMLAREKKQTRSR
jgi:ActR/RegA family two-component response regulator